MLFKALLVVALAGQSVQLAAQNPVTPLAPSTDRLGEAYYLFIDGLRLQDDDDLTGARDRYQRALRILPNSAPILVELAGVHARLGEVDDARAQARRALTAAPDNRDAHRLLGLLESSALQTGARSNDADVLRAIDHLERALTGGVIDLPVQLTLGELYIRNGQHQKAIDTLQRFLEERPGFPQALLLLAQAYRAAGRTADAEQVMEGLNRVRPNVESNRVAEAEQLERRGRWGEAATLWSEIVRAPNGGRFRSRHALALANSGDLAGASDVLNAIVRDTPGDVTAWYLLTQVELRDGDLTAAEAAARRIATIDAADARGPISLAQVLAARDDYRGVVSALTSRVEGPTDADLASGAFAQMASLLSAAYAELDDTRRAVQVLERAHDRAPTDDEVAFSLGAAYETDQRYAQAERVFRDVIARDPEHAAALNYLGYMLADRGEKLDEARGFIERALAIDSDNPAYLDSLGWAFFRLKRFEEAREPLERAAAAMRDSSVVQDHLGDLYFAVQRYSDAAAAFERALAGDRDGVDISEVTRKRDRARALATQ